MSELERRGPTIFDTLLLVAATAVGLQLSVASTVTLNGQTFREKPVWIFVVTQSHGAIAYYLVPMLVSWSIAAALSGLRSPGFAVVRKAPGWLGMATVSLVMLVHVVPISIYRWIIPTGHAMAADVIQEWHRIGSHALAASWIALRLAGPWRPSPTWADRLGRFLGWVWIASGVVVYATSIALAVLRFRMHLI